MVNVLLSIAACNQVYHLDINICRPKWSMLGVVQRLDMAFWMILTCWEKINWKSHKFLGRHFNFSQNASLNQKKHQAIHIQESFGN